ncbi:MAG: hypothetical protein PHV39_08710 [Methanomicrobium sp.]|nr:hypothetical protein [Methanomicrobium sp.]
MIRAGYIQKTGYPAMDSEGSKHQILEICVSKKTYAIMVTDLRRTLYTGENGNVWYIKQNWGRHIAAKAGDISLSHSKKAVNITLENGKRYTVSAGAIRNILSGYCSYSSVSEIESAPAKVLTSYQSAISPWIAV